MTVYEIYTDASFDKELSLGTCGFYIKENGKGEQHIVYTIANVTAIDQAESLSIQLALNHLIDNGVTKSHISLYSDSMTIVLKIRKGIEHEYSKDILGLIEILQREVNSFEFHHVKGHSPNGGHHNQINCLVDRSCRKSLREARQYYKR